MEQNEQTAKMAQFKSNDAPKSDRYIGLGSDLYGSSAGSLGRPECPPPYRATLRDRLKKTIDGYGYEANRARKSNELFDLLNKNPEVARILELIEEIGL